MFGEAIGADNQNYPSVQEPEGFKFIMCEIYVYSEGY